MKNIIEFLLSAKQNTYANDSGQTKSSRPNSYDLEYSKDDYHCLDTYLGTHSFSGQEVL